MLVSLSPRLGLYWALEVGDQIIGVKFASGETRGEELLRGCQVYTHAFNRYSSIKLYWIFIQLITGSFHACSVWLTKFVVSGVSICC